jgi:transcriptional regulator with XRE-family HTH domain
MAAQAVPQWSLGDRLRKALEFGKVSDEQMAAILGVTDRTVRNYTTDTTTPKRGVLKLWAEATGVPLDWLEQIDLRDAPDLGTTTSPCNADVRSLVLAGR